MYWMVGWFPGGSAGTSFCSGTEISISLRAMVFPRIFYDGLKPPSPTCRSTLLRGRCSEFSNGTPLSREVWALQQLLVLQLYSTSDAHSRRQSPSPNRYARLSRFSRWQYRRAMPHAATGSFGAPPNRSTD